MTILGPSVSSMFFWAEECLYSEGYSLITSSLMELTFIESFSFHFCINKQDEVGSRLQIQLFLDGGSASRRLTYQGESSWSQNSPPTLGLICLRVALAWGLWWCGSLHPPLPVLAGQCRDASSSSLKQHSSFFGGRGQCSGSCVAGCAEHQKLNSLQFWSYGDLADCTWQVTEKLGCFWPNAEVDRFFLAVHGHYFRSCPVSGRAMRDPPSSILYPFVVVPIVVTLLVTALVVWQSKRTEGIV
nr:receptor activity-modifying protein 1 isoform X1 [Aotus nancymaae]